MGSGFTTTHETATVRIPSPADGARDQFDDVTTTTAAMQDFTFVHGQGRPPVTRAEHVHFDMNVSPMPSTVSSATRGGTIPTSTGESPGIRFAQEAEATRVTSPAPRGTRAPSA